MIDHVKEFKRNGIKLGLPDKRNNTISVALFNSFVKSWEDRRKNTRAVSSVWSELPTHNGTVVGSSPTRPTNNLKEKVNDME